ncbi:MAG: hypothetical protein OJF61_000590 [Rhodanobacteraceae bacterium]|jgi:hypothetical protein|nr:MAG: hypothetical protein OJF61_000590 [Rhodanobacteraceae bacterium]
MRWFFPLPIVLLVASIYALWMDKIPRWLGVLGIIISLAVFVWAWHETTILYKMAGLWK